jgi:hypothetical protein
MQSARLMTKSPSENPLKVFVVSHTGHFIGGETIAVAPHADEACRLTFAALAEQGMTNEKIDKITEIDTSRPHAIVIDNGDY